MPETIGFVGVGRMGANMARRLKECRFNIAAVYDSHQPTSRALANELGATPCRTLAEVTAAAEVVITVVTDDRAMKSIFRGQKDNLLVGAKGRLFINCATVTPQVHVEIEKLARKVGAQSLEACMASSIPQARDGTLYLMCGGAPKAFQRAQPILNKLGQELRYVGKAGTAAQLKALVNMVMNINTAGLAEGLGLASALKLDLNTVMEVFSQTGANSRVLQTDGEDMRDREHSCFFSGAHAAKDSAIALKLGRDQKLRLPLATATKRQFDRMVKLGLGELDKSGVAELTFKGRGPKKRKK